MYSGGVSLRFKRSLSALFGLTLASKNLRASARNLASSGESLKSIFLSPLSRIALFEALHEFFFPDSGRARLQRQQLGAAEEEVAIHLPGEADAAVGLDVLLR